MLEPVTANQTRFVAPGLQADSRGIALGRFCLVLLPSVDRVVGLFRGLSERGSLDDLLATLRILQVQSPLKSRELLVQIPVTSSHVADSVAAAATLMGGLTFTGSAKHFVKYRDATAPLGFDVDALHPGAGDFILYAADFVQAYNHERELPFARLVLGLSLERDRQAQLLAGETALVRAVPGLWRVLTAYLHRNNVHCEVAACQDQSRRGKPGERFYLMRCRLQPRMVHLFCDTPGIEVHQLMADNLAVQLGFRHPIELTSCSAIFDRERFYLFSGERDCLDVVTGGARFFSASALVRIGDPGAELPQHTAVSSELVAFSVPLRLVAASGPRPPVRAARIPLAQAGWLKKLVYLLPPGALERYQICIGQDSIFLLSDSDVEFIPLGTLYAQVALGVMVPVGYELLPRVQPEVLVRHLGTESDALVFFTPGAEAPFRLSRAAFAPLSRRALARVEVQQAGPQQALVPAEAGDEQRGLVNDPVGTFPLWGFSDTPKPRDG